MSLRTDMALFRQFLRNEVLQGARGGYADPVFSRYRALARAGDLDEAQAREYAELFNRIHSRWRWRQATAQVLARRQAVP
ncbi:hypothetical protein [Herbaspirillum sp. NPDC101397]|uniref:hypothetical protein n=1 Tax=Herbaspirillum sp. NPDC101397 TaxID=3364006 RepID=UPI00383AD61F